jgi:serine/threonine protein kinase
MRYVDGSDLKGLLRREGRLEPAPAIAICAQIAAALDAAHARGLVHRDVKPSNVVLDDDDHAYLSDFGLARRLGETIPSVAGELSLGTPAYASPEQVGAETSTGGPTSTRSVARVPGAPLARLPDRVDLVSGGPAKATT